MPPPPGWPGDRIDVRPGRGRGESRHNNQDPLLAAGAVQKLHGRDISVPWAAKLRRHAVLLTRGGLCSAILEGPRGWTGGPEDRDVMCLAGSKDLVRHEVPVCAPVWKIQGVTVVTLTTYRVGFVATLQTCRFKPPGGGDLTCPSHSLSPPPGLDKEVVQRDLDKLKAGKGVRAVSGSSLDPVGRA